MGETEGEVREQVQRLSEARNRPIDRLIQQAVVGTPEQCIDQLLGYSKLGVADFIIAARPPTDKRVLELVAHQIAPVVKAEGISSLDT